MDGELGRGCLLTILTLLALAARGNASSPRLAATSDVEGIGCGWPRGARTGRSGLAWKSGARDRPSAGHVRMTIGEWPVYRECKAFFGGAEGRGAENSMEIDSMKEYTVSLCRPPADLGGEQAPLPETVSIMEIGVVTGLTEGALLSQERSTATPRAKSCPLARARGSPCPSFQIQHREGLCRRDKSVHHFPRDAALREKERTRNQRRRDRPKRFSAWSWRGYAVSPGSRPHCSAARECGSWSACGSRTSRPKGMKSCSATKEK
jgi:hypothetical protein